jgi:hypothetical protein
MEARLLLPARLLIAAAALSFSTATNAANGYRTTNFVVSAPTPQLAKEIGDAAEVWRKKLAIEWIGREMPPWSQSCPITARVAPRLGAGGATTFIFDRGDVFGWEMNIQGSRERVLDSVLPHEITHTIFACYFRQPLPRWADEGACTTVEHPSEIATQERLLIDFLHNGKGIPFNKMFAMKEYPPDVLPLYAQGHSLTRYLLMKRGKPAFLDFLADGMRDENWPRAVQQHYGHENLYELQNDWLGWVKQGRPELSPGAPATLVATNQPVNSAEWTEADSPTPSSEVVPVSAAEPVHESAYARAARASGKLPTEPVYDASTGTAWRR